jgi:hypothetical protein
MKLILILDDYLVYKDEKGKLHNETGPAISSPLSKFWYLNGNQLTEKEFEERVK